MKHTVDQIIRKIAEYGMLKEIAGANFINNFQKYLSLQKEAGKMIEEIKGMIE